MREGCSPPFTLDQLQHSEQDLHLDWAHVELTQYTGTWVSQSQSCEQGRAVPMTYLSNDGSHSPPPSMPGASGKDVPITTCHGLGRDKHPLPPIASGGRAGLEVRRTGELSLPLVNCSTQESDPYTSTGQHSRGGPEGVGVENRP